jgi:hypothetical protein
MDEVAVRPALNRQPVKAWTVMVFMQAELEQEPYAARHIREMKRVGSSPQLNIVVQLRDFIGYSRRWFISRGRARSCELSDPVNVKRHGPSVLRDFLQWATEQFPAERYMLVLCGHSYGLRFGHEAGDAVNFIELAEILRALKARRGANLDILGFNSCTMSVVEAACEFGDSADFMIAPQTVMPFPGWPYEAILRRLRRNPSIEPAQLGERVVRSFVRSYKRRHVALTMLDLRKAERLKSAVGSLTKALDATIRRRDRLNQVEEAFLHAACYEYVRPLIDLRDLCGNLHARVGDSRVRRAAASTIEAIRPHPGGVVRAHASRGLTRKGLHGVGIYAAHVTGRADWRSLEMVADRYPRLKLNRVTAWHRLAHKLGRTA